MNFYFVEGQVQCAWFAIYVGSLGFRFNCGYEECGSFEPAFSLDIDLGFYVFCCLFSISFSHFSDCLLREEFRFWKILLRLKC